MIINTICCDKEMIKIENNFCDMNVNYEELLICGECGTLNAFRNYSLDDEELSNLLKTHETELSETKIYKEIFENE